MKGRKYDSNEQDGNIEPGWKDALAFILAIFSYVLPLIIICVVALLLLLVIFKWVQC